MPQTEAQYQHERRETVMALRSLCADFGDLDWTEDLHMADVLSKHLAPYLYQSQALFTRRKEKH